eukprot:scaffold283114_cov30-Tisochrysis_lutea.AAC.1
MAAAWCEPHEILRTSCRSLTGIGLALKAPTAGLPSWPVELQPLDHTSPDLRRRSVKSAPHAAMTTRSLGPQPSV